MKFVSIAETKSKLSEYVERCRREAVVVTKHGQPRAALIPLEDADDLERFLLSRNPRFLQLLAAAHASDRVLLREAEEEFGKKRKRRTATTKKKAHTAKKSGKERA
jgi:prevent-host-death family protein